MKTIQSFEEAGKHIAAAISPPTQTRAYTLERINALLDFLGQPQDQLKVLHVAGTSGKTSTAYYCAALLKAAGYKVGLTVSPHVDEMNERVQIGLVPLPEKQFCKELSEFLLLVQQSKLKPTYFELFVAFAYWEFVKQKVDYAVVEVGLGGLLDGTNTITRPDKLCVITDIGLDHTDVLGETLEEIATQKAGIIHEQNQVFMNRQTVAAARVIENICYQVGAGLHLPPVVELRIPKDLPLYQQRNFGLALLVCEFALARDHQRFLTSGQIEAAAMTHIPGRMEIVEKHHKTLVLDGAHNGQKMHALAESLRQQYPDQEMAVMIGFASGNPERLSASLQEILPFANRLIITSFTSAQDVPKQAVAPEDIAAVCEGLGFEGELHIVESATEAARWLLESPEPVLLVTGSFYLLHAVRQLLLRA